jgi:hypothetical protein
MPHSVLFSIVETPAHPDLSAVYRRLGITETRFASMRKALAELKHTAPDFVVAEFLYGYGNNYAGVNISNLDVFLYSLQKYAPQAKVVVLVDPSERQYVQRLLDLFPVYAVLQQPVREADLEAILGGGV